MVTEPKNQSKALWTVGGVTLLWPSVLSPLIGRLGDVDTVCQIIRAKCGAGSLVNAVLTSGWWEPILIIAGLFLITRAERIVTNAKLMQQQRASFEESENQRKDVSALEGRLAMFLDDRERFLATLNKFGTRTNDIDIKTDDLVTDMEVLKSYQQRAVSDMLIRFDRDSQGIVDNIKQQVAANVRSEILGLLEVRSHMRSVHGQLMAGIQGKPRQQEVSEDDKSPGESPV